MLFAIWLHVHMQNELNISLFPHNVLILYMLSDIKGL